MSAISRVPSVHLHMSQPAAIAGPKALRSMPRFAPAFVTDTPCPGPVRDLPPRPLPRRAPYTQARLMAPLLNMVTNLQMTLLRARGFHHHCIETPAARMYSIDAPGCGPLPTIVLLPGFAAEAAQYSTLLERLLPHCQRVVALDPPGHGRSELPCPVNTANFNAAIADTLHHLVDGPFILIGHSAGGYAAIRYALQNPERVLALALAAPAGGPYTAEQEAYYSRIMSVPTWQDARIVTQAGWGKRRLLPLLTAATYARLSADPLRTLCFSDLLRDWLQPEELQGLRCPLMYLWPEREALLPPEFFPYFASHLPPHSEIRVEPGLTHCNIVDGRYRIVRTLVDFFNRVGQMSA